MNTKAMQETDDIEDTGAEEDESAEIEVDDDSDFEIEIVDDVPEDRKPKRPEGQKADVPDDEEIENYSEKVQKRIKQLRFEYHEEKRQREEAARLRDEAVRYAQNLYNENQKLQQSLTQNQGSLIEQAKGRATAELERARVAYRTAYEAGDADGLLDAQTKLAEAQSQLTQLANYRPPAPQPQRQQQPQYQPQQPQQPQPERPRLTPRQQRWMEANPWYGDNSEMTGYALGVHERLVKSGVDPDSQEYYNGIDAAVRRRFADEFSDVEEEATPRQRKASNVVAPAARSTKKPRQRVRLTATQLAFAKKANIPPEKLAAQILKEQGNG